MGRKPLTITDDERILRRRKQNLEGQHRFTQSKYGRVMSRVKYYKQKFKNNVDFNQSFISVADKTPEEILSFCVEFNNKFKLASFLTF
jgi:hypothetical protein